jgi:hypothetical protein
MRDAMLLCLVGLSLPSDTAPAQVLLPSGREVTFSRSSHGHAKFCDDGRSRQLVTHHKAGSWMLNVAVQWIDHAAALACASTQDSFAPVELDWIGLAVFHPYMPWLSKPKQHVLQVARNPFEVIASEYAYDLSDAEPTWMSAYAMADMMGDSPSECVVTGNPFCVALRCVFLLVSCLMAVRLTSTMSMPTGRHLSFPTLTGPSAEP